MDLISTTDLSDEQLTYLLDASDNWFQFNRQLRKSDDRLAGLNVVTGETGAGKSILLDALGLALGERADSSLVRSGAAQASVSAVFDVTAAPGVHDIAREHGIELDDTLARRMSPQD